MTYFWIFTDFLVLQESKVSDLGLNNSKVTVCSWNIKNIINMYYTQNKTWKT